MDAQRFVLSEALNSLTDAGRAGPPFGGEEAMPPPATDERPATPTKPAPARLGSLGE
jgi:hypothetical protein